MLSETLIIPTFIAVLILIFFLARMVYLSRTRIDPEQIPQGFRLRGRWIISTSNGEAIPREILKLWTSLHWKIQREYGNDFRIFLSDPVIQSWSTLWR
jgi:hypothetical protein